MSLLDKITERTTRHMAQHSSRRSLLKGLGTFLVGAGAVPLLPVSRVQAAEDPRPPKAPQDEGAGDPASCDYWRYCAIDGYLCECCGGSYNTCPPGTTMSPITWIGTCRNPVDGRNYVISYNDCCGKDPCGACLCLRDEGDRPIYRADKSNDANWCLGLESAIYHCSTAIVVGVAFEE